MIFIGRGKDDLGHDGQGLQNRDTIQHQISNPKNATFVHAAQ